MEISPAIFLPAALAVTCYAILIAAFTAGLRRLFRREPLRQKDDPPFVSVIIAMRNEKENLSRLLDGLRDQDYPADRMEVIVSDDYSGDGSAAVAEEYGSLHPGFPLMVLHAATYDAPGKKPALCRAVDRARGEILLFTDADTGRRPGWISAMTAGLSDPVVKTVLGPVHFSDGKNALQRMQEIEFLGVMGVTAGSASLGRPVMANGANLACRRSAWRECGPAGRDLRYPSGDDQFLVMSVRKRFGKGAVTFCPDPRSVVATTAEPRWTGFVHQRLRWISKSRGYRDPAVIGAGLLTGAVHLVILAGFVAGFFRPAMWPFVGLLWVVKVMADAPLVWRMGRFFGKKINPGEYLLAQVFQSVYIPAVGVLGMILPYRWKGRRASATAIS